MKQHSGDVVEHMSRNIFWNIVGNFFMKLQGTKTRRIKKRKRR
jgi:hypothetical protein